MDQEQTELMVDHFDREVLTRMTGYLAFRDALN
jgi:hypothetical protein